MAVRINHNYVSTVPPDSDPSLVTSTAWNDEHDIEVDDGLSVVGKADAAAGIAAEITASLDGQVLRRSGSTLGFGAIDLSNSNSITGSLSGNFIDYNTTNLKVTDGQLNTIQNINTTATPQFSRLYLGTVADSGSFGTFGNWAPIMKLVSAETNQHNTEFVTYRVSGAREPIHNIGHARGSEATPAALVNGDGIYTQTVWGYGTSGWRECYIWDATVDGTVGTGAPTKLRLRIQSNTSGLVETQTWNADGSVAFAQGISAASLSLTTPLTGANGGTGVANTGKTITLGGSLTTSGAYDSTFTMTGTTSVTFPTSGTLATTAGTVASITGTANQVLANGTSGSAQTGAVTLTLPQNIGTGSSPTFSGLTLSGGSLNVGEGNINNPDSIIGIAGVASYIRTNTTLGSQFALSAYDIDNSVYKDFLTLSAGNTPTLAISAPSGGTVSIDGATIGGTTPAAATFTSASATTFTGALSGNATTATTLQTARNINGVSFNGSADITVTAAAGTLTGTTLAANVVSSSLTSVGTITFGVWNAGAVTSSGDITTTADLIACDASNAGNWQVVRAYNSNNANGSSHAALRATTAGSSSGDPKLVLTISGVLDWSMGVDNSDSDSLKIALGDGPEGTVVEKMTSAGEITRPLQPAFLVHRTTDLTSLTKGVDNTFTWNTEIYDQGGDFASNTFTAPVTGRYHFCVTGIGIESFNSATRFFGKLVTSNRPYALWDTNPTADNPGVPIGGGSTYADMDAGDTAYLITYVSGGTSTYALSGSSENAYFSGSLIC